ncbi:Hamartin protein-domain-containing protein [Apodospora peruviana]|uniref:Hamartin protein-domain-containing protein n=1 Tax=Apodospora peruviana TaxID=516989 RepID=A0AAE0M5E2_9PEZI|nr:Hamartin protein-domain-containing protein [Apodospora peruviana]
MASSGSVKDLTKAVNTFMQAPVLPLPDELTAIISGYLDRHAKSDDGTADRVNEELLSIYGRTVHGHPEKYAGFLAILRELRPAIRTPARIFEWWDRLLDPVLEHVDQERGLAKEVLNNTLDLLSIDESDTSIDASQAGLTPFTNRLLSRWMEARANHPEDVFSVDFKESMVKKALMVFGKKDPKGFMNCLNNYVVKKDYRNSALSLLCDFVQSQPPHLHLVLQTDLFANILHSLQKDDSTSTITVALVAVMVLLPYIPSSLVPFLPTLFNIYARLLFWDRDSYFAQEHTEIGVESERAKDEIPWEKCLLDPDRDGSSLPYLTQYFTMLYGLYPLNFMDYIRKPQRYLRHANNADDIDVQAMEIRDRSEQFREQHRLHPNFYNLTIESEKTDLSRWIKSEADEVLGNCLALFIEPAPEPVNTLNRAPPPGVVSYPAEEQSISDSPESDALLGGSFKDDSNAIRASMSANMAASHLAILAASHSQGRTTSELVRRGSQSSHPSGYESFDTKPHDIGGDSPTLPPHLVQSSSHTQLQDIIHSNKMRKSNSLHLPANDSVPSLALSLQQSATERSLIQPSHTLITPNTASSVTELGAQVSRLYHENLLLRNDLQFERYINKQHISHMGELRRKQIREAATEAETQNLVMANRSLKQRLDDAKNREAQLKKEFENRRNMAKKWETSLSDKVKTLRDEQKKWASESKDVKRQLEKVLDDSRRLRKLIDVVEEKKLKAEQSLEAVDISADEIQALKAEIARLSEAEREYQAKQLAMTRSMEESQIAKNKADQLSKDLTARDHQLYQTKKNYESQIIALNTKLARALKETSGKSASEVAAVYESALASSRAKQAELQKQYSALMRKYTVLQSSLLDMSCDAAEKKGASHEPSSSFSGEHELPPMSRSPISIRNRSRRGFSDPEAFDVVSHNATPPLEPVSSSVGSPTQRPATPSGTGAADVSGAGKSTSPQAERYHGRGGVQNAIRKERKDKKEEKSDKKDKRSAAGLRGIRGFV